MSPADDLYLIWIPAFAGMTMGVAVVSYTTLMLIKALIYKPAFW